MMPELSGWEVCTTLKSAPETRQIPIAMLTVKSEIRDLITGMQVGADDYITKPFTRKQAPLDRPAAPRREARRRARRFLTSENEDVRFKNLLFDPVTRAADGAGHHRRAARPPARQPRHGRPLRRRRAVQPHRGRLRLGGLRRPPARTPARPLRRMLGTVFATEDFVAVNRAGGSDFYVFTTPRGGRGRRRAPPAQGAAGRGVAARHARRGLRRPHPQADRRLRRARAASARTRRCASSGSCIARSRQAIAVATTKEEERQALLRETFKDILRQAPDPDRLPADLPASTTLELFGHEALTRGPVDTAFESPELLFQFAGEHEATWELEQLCIGSSAAHYRRRTGGPLLFINVEADSVTALAARGPQALAPLFALRDRRSSWRSRSVPRSATCPSSATPCADLRARASGSRSTTRARATRRSSRSRSCARTSSRSPTRS